MITFCRHGRWQGYIYTPHTLPTWVTTAWEGILRTCPFPHCTHMGQILLLNIVISRPPSVMPSAACCMLPTVDYSPCLMWPPSSCHVMSVPLHVLLCLQPVNLELLCHAPSADIPWGAALAFPPAFPSPLFPTHIWTTPAIAASCAALLRRHLLHIQSYHLIPRATFHLHLPTYTFTTA